MVGRGIRIQAVNNVNDCCLECDFKIVFKFDKFYELINMNKNHIQVNN